MFNKLKSMNMALCKQELYDLSLDEISVKLDPLEFFDPDLYYRLLEEYFNVNIYVFGSSNGSNSMIVPRYKSFHTRPNRDRLTVLIYKNNQQCELIINQLSDQHKMLIFDTTMGKYCHQFLQQVMHTYTMSGSSSLNINIYNNLYSIADHLKFIPNIMSQYIDEDGKVRALNININNQLMTLMILPSQPENFPIDLNIHYIDAQLALTTMTQQPTGITKSNDMITGLWYKIYDVEYGEYIPIKPIKTLLNLDKIGPNQILLNKSKSMIGQYTFTKKILNRLLNIVQWLYLVAMYKFNLINTVDEFFDQYVIYMNDSSTIYNDLMTIPRRFPVYENYASYFDYIAKYCPALSTDKLIMYNQDFYNKVKNYMVQFNLNDNDIPIYIKNYYEYVSDFKTSDNTFIFLNKETLLAWQEHHQDIYYQIVDTIYPYIYKTNYGKMFIIQNVYDYKLETALSVSHHWHQYSLNIGPQGKTDTEMVDFNIYKVNDLKKLELVHMSEENRYHILDYNYRLGRVGSGKYAAMLPL